MRNFKFFLLLVLLSIISIGIGVVEVDFKDLFDLNSKTNQIILLSRIPRTISIIVAGFGLSICGLIMQQLMHNKYVSPTTAGVEESAKFGILISMLLLPAASVFLKIGFAIIFSLLGTLIFLKMTNSIKIKDPIFIPLVGIMLSSIIASLTNFFAYSKDLIQNINAWMFGNFSHILVGKYEILYLTIPFVIIAFIYAKRFTIAGLGEDMATNLGLSYKKIVNLGFFIVCALTSVVIITVGTIPFLGLVVPNIVSMKYGDNLEKNIFLTGIFGSIFLLICDILGRLIIYPYEIPIGLTVGVIGSGMFLFLIVRGQKHAE